MLKSSFLLDSSIDWFVKMYYTINYSYIESTICDLTKVSLSSCIEYIIIKESRSSLDNKSSLYNIIRMVVHLWFLYVCIKRPRLHAKTNSSSLTLVIMLIFFSIKEFWYYSYLFLFLNIKVKILMYCRSLFVIGLIILRKGFYSLIRSKAIQNLSFCL